MSIQIIPVFFLLLFVCCHLCGQGCGAVSLPSSRETSDETTLSDFFKLEGENIEYGFDYTGAKKGSQKIDVKNIGPIFLVATNDFLVALAEVKNGEPANEKINVLAKFLKTGGEKLGKDAFKGDGWKKQLVTKTATDLKNKFKVKSFAVVVNSNKIYYFVVTGTTVAGAVSADNSQLEITVIVGEIDSDSPPKEAMKWDTLGSDKLTNTEELNNKVKIDSKKISPAVGFGFAIGDTIVFAIQGEGKEKNQNVIAFFTLDTTGKNLKLLHEEPTGNCHPSLFLWKKQIFMVPTVCAPNSNQKIKVFDYKGNQLTENNEPINFLQEFLNDKKNFVTTKTGTTTIDVLLFTQQSSSGNFDVNLWMTDGSRTAKVDTIITGSKDSFDLSMLHANDDLFVLYEKKAESGGGIAGKSTYNLKRLPDQLEKIKLILLAWGNINNDKIKSFFEQTATTSTFSFTNGLVGFLAGDNQNDDYWKDEFFYENATVTPTSVKEKPTKVAGGFKFNGAGAGAKWPVGKSKENQPYNFANPGFTLVATVKIDSDEDKKRRNSILGVGLEGDNSQEKGIGLWCDKGKWSVESKKSREEAKSTEKQCVPGGLYHMALILNVNFFSVYIGKNKIKEIPVSTIDAKKPLNIKHFYFGVENDAEVFSDTAAESHVTVTNVLLYNRPFEEGEISKLKEDVEPVEVAKPPDNNTNTTPQRDDVTSTSLQPGPIGDEQKEEGKGPSPSRTEDGGVGGGVRVFSLLLAVLCVSAPLLHL